MNRWGEAHLGGERGDWIGERGNGDLRAKLMFVSLNVCAHTHIKHTDARGAAAAGRGGGGALAGQEALDARRKALPFQSRVFPKHFPLLHVRACVCLGGGYGWCVLGWW